MKDRFGHDLQVGDEVMWFIEYCYTGMTTGFRGNIGVVTHITESNIQVDWQGDVVFPIEEYDVSRVITYIVKVDSPEFTVLYLKTDTRP